MARRKTETFTDVELAFMHILWERGEASTEHMMDELAKSGRPLTDGSIRKVLGILVDKGHVIRQKSGRSFIYSPVVSRREANRKMVCDLLGRAFGGSTAYMVASLLDSNPVPKEDLDAIERLIAERKKEVK